MDQQVSPAVVIIVLILIVAILVGLYFLVVERGPQSSEGDMGVDMAPIDDPGATMPPDANAEDASGVTDAGDESAQVEPDVEQTDADSSIEAEPSADADAGEPVER